MSTHAPAGANNHQTTISMYSLSRSLALNGNLASSETEMDTSSTSISGPSSGEETFSELYDEVNAGTNDFERVDGLCMRDGENVKFTGPRALIADLNTIPYPAYDLFETDIYFRYSTIYWSYS